MLYAANSAAVGVPVSGVGFGNRSHVRAGAGVRMFPLIASQMFMILVVDCIRSYHDPQFGPIKVGMWNLLISMVLRLFCFYENFL